MAEVEVWRRKVNLNSKHGEVIILSLESTRQRSEISMEKDHTSLW